MKGLLKNNFYAVCSSAKIFSVFALLLGAFAVVMDNKIPSLIIGYMFLVMIGFPLNSMACLRKESVSKWNKYKLTTPVKRFDIVESYFLCLLLWVLIGIIFAGVVVTLSVMLHGFPFNRNTDVFLLLVVGAGVSLFTGAIFFPLFYLGGEERSEVFLGISLLCAIGIVMGITTLLNILFGDKIVTWQIILGAVIILTCALLAFAISCPVAVAIFTRREY